MSLISYDTQRKLVSLLLFSVSQTPAVEYGVLLYVRMYSVVRMAEALRQAAKIC